MGYPVHAGIDRCDADPSWLVQGGYPVHAGIDPSTGCPFGPDIWLPRTRGDRPLILGCLQSPLQATPYTRGSTFVDVARDRIRPGYPAHAGVDPPVMTGTNPLVGSQNTSRRVILATSSLAGGSNSNAERIRGISFPFCPQTDILFLHTCPISRFGCRVQAN